MWAGVISAAESLEALDLAHSIKDPVHRGSGMLTVQTDEAPWQGRLTAESSSANSW